MGSSASSAYKDLLEGKLITAVSTGTTTGVQVKVKQINGATPTWTTVAHRLKVIQRTATTNKAEVWQVAAGTTQSGQTVTLGTLTRALPLSDGTDFTGSGTAQSFAAGADVFLAWDAHDGAMTPKLDIVNTFTDSGALRSSSTTTPILRLNSVTTSQRNAMSASNGDLVYDSSLGQVYKYEGGAWSAVATGSFSNAANGTAGKVDLATAAEVVAGTANDATSGAPNVIPVSIVKTSSSGAANGSVVALNSAVAVDVSVGGTGRTSVTSGNLLLGAGTSQMTLLAPGSSGNVVTSNGSTFTSSGPTYTAKCVYASGASSSQLSNPTSLTAFDTHTFSISANDLIAGVVYEFECGFSFGWGAGALYVTPMLGSTDMLGNSGTNTPTGSSTGVIKGYLAGTAAAGASVAVRVCAIQGIQESGKLIARYASANVATNGTLTLQFGAQFTSSNGSNNITLTMVRITKQSATVF